MIEPDHPRLSIVRQCELASIGRSSFYREPTAENEETLGDIISHVLIHEIGHHFGLSDDDIEAIESSVAAA